MDFNQINQGFDMTQDKLDAVSDAAEKLVGGPLERLIGNLSKTADGTRTFSQSLDRFADDILKSLTRLTVENIFENNAKPHQPSGVLKPDGGLFAEIGRNILPNFMQSALHHPYQAGPGIQVTVHNNAPVTPQVQERTNSRGQREIEIMIDNMVASSLAQGSQTRSVLQSVFGLTNLLRAR